ncbi:MAG: TrpB-like pyridoxal phosphate-dependent enzyme [Intrasporangiaceae bacterium]|nr:TrpB-like pyridoxal phosphate-dependent enzyme [Intrasporangiaceae bacterium]
MSSTARDDAATKILLDESEIPTHWYNVVPDLPAPPPPPLHPGTHEPIGPEALAPLFPMALILQEVSTDRYIEIPQAVRDIYALWRPSPLYRAKRLEEHLDTPAKGRAILAQDPDSPGSLGIAISEAVEAAMADEETKYALGSVLNHVLLHQTVIGEEALLQLAKTGDTPDLIVGCTGGGSNFAGLFFPFLREKLAGKMDPQILAVEPAACPSLTKGEYRYDFGDVAGMTPLMKMHTLGHDFVPDPIHAGGLRYHGMSPLISHMYELDLFDAEAINQTASFAAGVTFARTQGIVPAPEPTVAIAAAIREAEACRETGEEKVILTALCGHGHFDMAAYDAYFAGELIDHAYPTDKIADAMSRVPVVDA